MNLWNKLSLYIDYNNTFSISRAYNTLFVEFYLARKNKNVNHMNEITKCINNIISNISANTSNKPNFNQTRNIEKGKKLIKYIAQEKRNLC